MSTYTVKLNLHHNGTAYVPGETVELDEKAAAVLVKDGVVEAAGKTTEKSKTTTVKPESQKEPEGPSYKELQEEAKSLGLPHVGVSKADLVKTIAEAKTAKKDDPENTDGSDNTNDPNEETGDDL